MEGDHLVTQLLADVAAGKNGAAEQIVEVVYAEFSPVGPGLHAEGTGGAYAAGDGSGE